MSDLKPELSDRNKYWISKHRYYELKHFCLQYPEWRKLYADLEFKMEARKLDYISGSDPSDPTAKYGQLRAELKTAMDLVSKSALESSKELGAYIFKAVTDGIPFVRLQTFYDIPCGKDMYYDTYRKFFWILSNKKGI